MEDNLALVQQQQVMESGAKTIVQFGEQEPLCKHLAAVSAAISESVANDLRVHLGLVALLVVLALGLLWGDGGYPGAAWMRRCVGMLALLSAAGHYLVWPLIRPVQIR